MEISANNLEIGYGEFVAVQDMDIQVKKGEITTIIGPNGSGKSTVLKALTRLLKYRKGIVRLDSRDLLQFEAKELARRVAMMSQFAGASLPYTVEETVRMGRYVHQRSGFFSGMFSGFLSGTQEKDREVTDACIRAAGLWEKRSSLVTELSGGQLQRVFLARALAQEPLVMLLHEPTSHMDLKYQTGLVDYLKKWGEETGHTVVGVLHDISLALRLADRFCFLKDGQVLACGDASVITPELLEETYEMDVAAWMKESAGRMEEILNGKHLPQS